MKLYFTRHGETLGNLDKICQGHTQGILTENGKEQARRLGERLRNEHFKAIYSSDLQRAIDTAKSVAQHHQNTPLYLVQELREKHHGNLQGRSLNDLTEEELRLDKIFDYRSGNGESWLDVYNRIVKFFEEIYSKHQNDNVLFVTHGGTTKMLTCKLRNIPAKNFFSVKGLSNTGLSIYEINKNNYTELLHNCLKHLE
ncbi:histidine phosphatase family protein [archaeon]|nr:histidine phosphatase family protein [archaeon]